jgi:hypothetical protein
MGAWPPNELTLSASKVDGISGVQTGPGATQFTPMQFTPMQFTPMLFTPMLFTLMLWSCR